MTGAATVGGRVLCRYGSFCIPIVVQLLKGMYVKFRQDHQRMERSKKSIPITVPPTDICCIAVRMFACTL